MNFRIARSVLLAVCGLALAASRLAAQEVSPLPIAPVPFFDSLAQAISDPSVRPDRRGSPAARLENLIAGPAAEPQPEADEIETDRDSFTPTTTTVGRNRTVLESAYSFIDNRGIKETNSLPEFLLRYGVSDRIELRLGWNYEVGGIGNPTTGADAADDDPTRSRVSLVRDYTLAYGAKIGITEQDGWFPRTIAILQGFTPTGGSIGSSTATQLIATYAAGWTLPNRWKFDTAFRYGTESEDGERFNQWAPSAVLKVPLGEKWAVHGEYFGIFSSGKEQNSTQHYFSPGLHYLVTPNLEVGFRLGWGLNNQSDRFFTNIGFGGRF